ncbi:MAG: NO-inducible flavohemoprotein [Thiomicrospira sp.]|nr:MAG: NO-inducible flavohemoprotein [Thiomicrospira sp.]
MLSNSVIQTIKETAPVLAEQGLKITDLFYQKLFLNHPELQNIFNMANQAQGEQSRALAESVFMYASKIDELQELTPMVKRIANKHASLSIQPEHYPIVGKYLLEAIEEHLELPKSHPILDAWRIAYNALADIFIATEEDIYLENEQKIQGWRGFKPFKIDQITTESKGIKSFYLKAEDGRHASFEAGQYVGVRVKPEKSDYEEIRQYSLSNAPGEDFYRITVKQEGHGSEFPGTVSNHLHKAKVSDTVWLQPPTGDFTIQSPDSSHITFIAGGVGLTPLLSMLLQQLKTMDANKITFIQCCRDSEHHLMKKAITNLQQRYGFHYYVVYEVESGADHQGYLTKEVLQKWLPDNTQPDVYFCGSKPFMSAVNKMCSEIGISEQQRHYEIFGPTTTLS